MAQYLNGLEVKDWNSPDNPFIRCNECGEKQLDYLRGELAPVDCACVRAAKKLIKDREDADYRVNRARQLRIEGIEDPERRAWTFEVDDRKTFPEISDLCLRYIEKWGEVKDSGRGLIFYGSVGVGKSFYASCVATAVCNRLSSVFVTTVPRIAEMYLEADFGNKEKIYERIRDVGLLVIDDLGTERNTEYSIETLYRVIDTRILSGKPLVVTTNLGALDLTEVKDLDYKRVYDRLLPACYPIKMVGPSRRIKEAEKNRKAFEALLGI